MKIDRGLLADIGFIKGNGWSGEVWVYDGMFWVYFYREKNMPFPESCVHSSIDRKVFFKMFIKAIEGD